MGKCSLRHGTAGASLRVPGSVTRQEPSVSQALGHSGAAGSQERSGSHGLDLAPAEGGGLGKHCVDGEGRGWHGEEGELVLGSSVGRLEPGGSHSWGAWRGLLGA